MPCCCCCCWRAAHACVALRFLFATLLHMLQLAANLLLQNVLQDSRSLPYTLAAVVVLAMPQVMRHCHVASLCNFLPGIVLALHQKGQAPCLARLQVGRRAISMAMPDLMCNCRASAKRLKIDATSCGSRELEQSLGPKKLLAKL